MKKQELSKIFMDYKRANRKLFVTIKEVLQIYEAELLNNSYTEIIFKLHDKQYRLDINNEVFNIETETEKKQLKNTIELLDFLDSLKN